MITIDYHIAILINVVGLPLARVVRLLRELGVVVPAGGRGDSGPEAAP